jgi:hypothetical protein
MPRWAFFWNIKASGPVTSNNELRNLDLRKLATFVLAILPLGLLTDMRLLNAAPPCKGRCASQSWHVTETPNFRILNYATQPVNQRTCDCCEAMRARLMGVWHASEETTWTPKCDIVLHPSDEAYLREVGPGGRSTVASSLIDRQQGRITARRIDIRSTRADWETNGLGHELTHVVIADRFADKTLPRWADEGIAILADPVEKRALHRDDLRKALAKSSQFRLVELLAMNDYPAGNRWGTFYGQSASLVEFLVDHAGSEQLVRFVELAVEQGHERALRHVYQWDVAELERRWHTRMQTDSQAADRHEAISPLIGPASPVRLELAKRS